MRPTDLAADLRAETLKWLTLAEGRLPAESGEAEFLRNVAAYISDARYFLDRDDLIRAFEAVVWAWAWMEIGERVGVLRSGYAGGENANADSSI